MNKEELKKKLELLENEVNDIWHESFDKEDGWEWYKNHPKLKEYIDTNREYKLVKDMKIKEYDYNWCPEGIDEDCINLCRTLNQLPGIETYESCEGHGRHPYWVFFRCTNLETISRLGRVVERNYSDNNWEIVVDSTDINPYGCFWLRTKTTLPDNELNESLKHLIENIEYWFNDAFDNYFNNNKK